MTRPRTIDNDTETVTAPMRRFVDYFGELGPRWGIRAETSKAHALLYLADRPLDHDEVAEGLGISKAKATAALRDLRGWDMASKSRDGRWRAGGQPWDLLFKALEARRRREIEPALDVLRACSKHAVVDPKTPRTVRRRIDGVLTLVENLAAIDGHAQRLPKSLIPRLVNATGAASRALGRLSPKTSGRGA